MLKIKKVSKVYEKKKRPFEIEPQEDLQFSILAKYSSNDNGPLDMEHFKIRQRILVENNLNKETDKLISELMYMLEKKDLLIDQLKKECSKNEGKTKSLVNIKHLLEIYDKPPAPKKKPEIVIENSNFNLSDYINKNEISEDNSEEEEKEEGKEEDLKDKKAKVGQKVKAENKQKIISEKKIINKKEEKEDIKETPKRVKEMKIEEKEDIKETRESSYRSKENKIEEKENKKETPKKVKENKIIEKKEAKEENKAKSETQEELLKEFQRVQSDFDLLKKKLVLFNKDFDLSNNKETKEEPNKEIKQNTTKVLKGSNSIKKINIEENYKNSINVKVEENQIKPKEEEKPKLNQKNSKILNEKPNETGEEKESKIIAPTVITESEALNITKELDEKTKEYKGLNSEVKKKVTQKAIKDIETYGYNPEPVGVKNLPEFSGIEVYSVKEWKENVYNKVRKAVASHITNENNKESKRVETEVNDYNDKWKPSYPTREWKDDSKINEDKYKKINPYEKKNKGEFKENKKNDSRNIKDSRNDFEIEIADDPLNASAMDIFMDRRGKNTKGRNYDNKYWNDNTNADYYYTNKGKGNNYEDNYYLNTEKTHRKGNTSFMEEDFYGGGYIKKYSGGNNKYKGYKKYGYY